MAIYVVAPRTGIVKEVCERSPNVVVASDAGSAERIPAAIRQAGEILWTEELAKAFSGVVPEGADGVVIHLEGERLLEGETADVRRTFVSNAGRISLVAVHLPGISGADLISVQPRAFPAGAKRESLNLTWRLQGSATISKEARAALEGNGAPWGRLYLALLEEQKQPGASIEALKKLSRAPGIQPMLAALVLRNLIVVLLRKRDFAKAEELLKLGSTAYPDCAECPYLTGLLWVDRKKPSNAMLPLEEALRRGNKGFVGSGGENSYRASWLLGVVHDFAGNQERAVACSAPGLYARPAFAPSVDLFLKQRMAPETAAAYRIPLCYVARTNPRYFEPVFSFLLEHRLFDVARVLLDTMPLVEDASRMLHDRLRRAAASFEPRQEPSAAKPGVMLSGPLFVHSGHARINREIGRALLGSDQFEAGLETHGWNSVQPFLLPQGEALRKGVERRPSQLDLTIRHQWPPDFRRPSAGKLACILPWEHRAVPSGWVERIERNVDELWVPSHFVRSAFVEGGVRLTPVHVIPNGVNTSVFCPAGRQWRPDRSRGFVFLFVGGTIARKGVDLLLQAYGDAFSADDDVTLVIKDVGSASFYQNNHLLAQIAGFVSQPGSPHLLTLSRNLDDAELASLYRGSDAFVLPYRGEGFGMPIVEAMACGKPVLVTAEGPAPEFCPPDCGYLIPAREVEVTEAPPPLGKFTSPWTWFEPDVAELARTMRQVFEHREEAAQRGAKAAEVIGRTLAWEHVLPMYLQRIARMTQCAAGQTFAGDRSVEGARAREEQCRPSLSR